MACLVYSDQEPVVVGRIVSYPAFSPTVPVSNRQRVLVVLPTLPYPPRQQGVAIRYGVILERLARQFDISLAIITSLPEEARADLGPVASWCVGVHIHLRTGYRPSLWRRARLRFSRWQDTGVPYRLAAHDAHEIKAFLERVSATGAFDTIVWVGSLHLDAGLAVFPAERVVWDPIDSIALHVSRDSQKAEDSAREANDLLAWERWMTGRVHVTTYASPIDAAFVRGEGVSVGDIRVVPNGVYVGDAPTLAPPKFGSAPCTIGFLGNMSYPPNVIAACRLAEVVARVRGRGHEVRLLIIGRDPDARVRALAGDFVEVTGTVPNVWTWIERVDVFAFPMTTGAGLQNKLLEAMYARRAVICTDVCNGGIQGRSEEHLLLAETDEDFIAAIERVIRSPGTAQEIAERGHALVQRAFDWNAILPEIAGLWARLPEAAPDARILLRP